MSLVFNIIFIAITPVLFTLYVQFYSHPIQCLDDVYHVKEGLIHGGGDGGEPFDDAKGYKLIYGDSCAGVEIHWSPTYLNSIRFIYNTSTTRNHIDRYASHGEDEGACEVFNLLPNEEINKVTVNVNIVPTSTPNRTYHLITGLQFHTSKGRSTQHYGKSTDASLTESYDGYTLFYVKGRSGRYIDQLQFVWFKRCSRINSKECMPP